MSELANDEFDKDYWFEMYQGQCKTTDDWAKKYRDEVERKADATLLARCEELQRIAEVANAMVGKERDQTMRQAKRITELEAENERAFQMLSAYGVPKERAKTVANGIDVLMMRMEKAGHSANTVGGPTPVMDAAPACEQPLNDNAQKEAS